MQQTELLLRRLDALIEESRKGGEPWGYFVATYRQALLRVLEWVKNSKFDDSVRMLHLVTALVER